MEALHVQAELLGVARHVDRAQVVLVGEQEVVHLPEGALRGRRLGRLGGVLGARVDVGEGQVPPHVADVDVGEELAHHRLGLPAVRALEVAELDHRDRGARRAADVVVVGVDLRHEVLDVGHVADQRPRLAAGGSSAVSRYTAQVSAADTTTAVSAPTFAWSSSAPWNARVAMSSATVKPTPAIVPLPSTAAQPTGGRIRPRDSRVTAHAVAPRPAACRPRTRRARRA